MMLSFFQSVTQVSWKKGNPSPSRTPRTYVMLVTRLDVYQMNLAILMPTSLLDLCGGAFLWFQSRAPPTQVNLNIVSDINI